MNVHCKQKEVGITMVRYCRQCGKGYDFKISNVNQLEMLKCPECGEKISKDSTTPPRPAQQVEKKQPADHIGNAFYKMTMFFLFADVICGILGVVFYCIGWGSILYGLTAMSIILNLIQTVLWFFGGSQGGVLWILLGGVLGFLLEHSLKTVCLGIMIALIIRFLFRVVIMKLIALLVKWGSEK